MTDVPYDNWQNTVRKIKPDIIYALLNSAVVPLAYEVMKNKGSIPMVWHFKESPHDCIIREYWNKLIDLYSYCEGKIYINPEIKLWYETFMRNTDGLSYIMDGDLPPKTYFTDRFSQKLSSLDGAFHTVVSGRMIGAYMMGMSQLAEHNIHVHMYSDGFRNKDSSFNNELTRLAPKHFHQHPYCDSENWVEEYSRYDAGWLHSFESTNGGEIMRATWDDLNMPARMNSLAAAGLPMIQYNNTGHIVATQEYLKKINAGLFYKEAKDLREQLADRQLMETLSCNILQNRFRFCFDEYVLELLDFFSQIIDKTKKR